MSVFVCVCVKQPYSGGVCTVYTVHMYVCIILRRNLRKASCVSFKVGADSSASSFFPSRPASRRVSTYKMRLAS